MSASSAYQIILIPSSSLDQSRDTQGEERDVVVNIGEAAACGCSTKATGQFIWRRIPGTGRQLHLCDIDLTTGVTTSPDLVLHNRVTQHRVFFNTRSYWPSAYDPTRNSIFVPFIRNCLNIHARAKRPRRCRDARKQNRNPQRHPAG